MIKKNYQVPFPECMPRFWVQFPVWAWALVIPGPDVHRREPTNVSL